MKITKEWVDQVATLARLNLSEEEVEHYSGQLEAILDYIEQLKNVDTQGIEGTSHVVPLDCVLRNDELQEPFESHALVSNAPFSEGSSFLVPKIIE